MSDYENMSWADLEVRANAPVPYFTQRESAEARAEIRRREEVARAASWEAQERARVQAQQFQAGLVDRQIAATKEAQDVQARIARSSASAAKFAAWATFLAAVATIGQLVVQITR